MKSFRFAAEHEGELNARQRDALRLLAAGRTNAEIATALEVTLDGAKWNVSEILTKLGFASREEAAAYWRWRNRPAAKLRRAARGLVPLGGLKLAAGGGALAVAATAAVVLVLALRGGEAPRTIPAGPFTVRAVVDVRASEPPGNTLSNVTWWYQDQRRYRYEFADTRAGRVVTGVADGTWLWFDTSDVSTYQRSAIPDLPGGMVASLPVSVLLGPSNAQGIDALLTELRERNSAPGSFARVAGTKSLRGFAVTIIETGPAWSSSSSSSGGGETVATGGVARLWVERGSMWVLKYESDGIGGSHIVAELTEFAFAAIDPAVFRFEPPPGKTLEVGE